MGLFVCFSLGKLSNGIPDVDLEENQSTYYKCVLKIWVVLYQSIINMFKETMFNIKGGLMQWDNIVISKWKITLKMKILKLKHSVTERFLIGAFQHIRVGRKNN